MGRQRRRKNKGDILIDLTSLLDVIFILLMIVLCNQQNETSEMQVQQEEAIKLSEQAKVQLQLYSDQMDTVDDFCMVSVNASYEPNNITTRHISIQIKGKETITLDMRGNSTNESLDKLEEILRDYIESNAGKPIILSLNERDENILYRDEKAIQDIFNELKVHSTDVYIK